MKKKIFYGILFLTILSINFASISNTSDGKFYLKDLVRKANADTEAIDPNMHYGYVRNTLTNCCKQRYHDDQCKGCMD